MKMMILYEVKMPERVGIYTKTFKLVHKLLHFAYSVCNNERRITIDASQLNALQLLSKNKHIENSIYSNFFIKSILVRMKQYTTLSSSMKLFFIAHH